MGAYGSISTGYDPGYLLRESSKGAEGYYLSAVAETGEPPGVWTGRACPALGLAPGAEVEPAVMEAIYGALLDPRDPGFADPDIPAKDKAHLGAAPRTYKTTEQRLAALLAAEPDATPERREQLAIQARKDQRQAVMFFDFTFSVDKSTSVLHASLQAAAARAERAGDGDAAAEYARQAKIVEDAIMAGSAAAIEYLQDEAGYSRAGYHGAVPKDEQGRPLAQHATGRYVDAHDWVVASFFQHTSRDGDPQLHAHNAILNRAQCDDDQVWRTIDSRGLHRARAAASAIGGRVMDERIARELAAAYEQRPDGHGRELTGVPEQVKKLFSSRRAVVTAAVAELAAAYTERHGHPPNARALFAMAQFATLNSRRAKPRRRHAPARGELLDQWAAQMTAAELGALDGIPAAVAGSLDPAAPGIAGLAGEEIARMLSAAVAEVQAGHAVWSRGQLLAAIDAQLPGWLGGLDAAQVRRVLEELTSQALAGGYGITSLEAPDLVPMPAQLRRSDGRSIYTPHDRALYTTQPQLDAEEQLLAAAGQSGAPAVPAAAAARALGTDLAGIEALSGRVPPAAALTHDDEHQDHDPGRRYAGGLRPDQAAAVYGILTSGRPADVLIGPAGTGKSRTMGTLAGLWPKLTGGQVTGVALAENAAQVLGAEGIGQAHNIARFLAAAARGQISLGPGDLLIVDEAGMVPTAELTALHHIARAAGAKLLLTGDPAQLPSVGAGGVLGMLAREHGYYQLTTVQRMAEQWEREASLQLRDGDTAALAAYDRHGRLTEGTAEQMTTAAYRNWLADHLAGRDSLLIARGNDQAAELSARARADLAAYGLVEEHGSITLSDGNTAGTGDLVQARRNDHDIEDNDGRWVANRDVWRIEGYARARFADEDEPPKVIVRRYLGRNQAGERQWSTPFTVPEQYLATDAVLAYAGTVHAAQGRTVDTCHALVDQAITRALLYVALTRGRLANYAYAVVEAATTIRPEQASSPPPGQRTSADLRPGTRPSPALTGGPPDAADDPAAPWAPEADRLSVLIAALERDDTETPALAVLRDELARAGHLAHLGAIWADLAAEESGRRYDAILQQALTPGQYARFQAEDARSTLYRQVRTAELAGHDPAALLRHAVGLRSLDDDPHRGPAEVISQVLHSRIRDELIGDPVPRPASFTDRTPPAADPEIGAVMRALAEAMDQRVADLGEQAAEQTPRWAAEGLGPVPAGPAERAGWSRRAGAIAAYREQYGYTDPARPIGREPKAPEARAAWHAAARALGRPEAGRDLAGASDGALWAARARYERELAWAPPHVGEQLRATAQARREHQTEAVLTRARARATTGPDRQQAEARTIAHEQLLETLTAREQLLADVDEQRRRWHEHTEQARTDAAEATAELRRRWPDAGRLPLRDPHRRDDPPSTRDRQDQPGREPQPAGAEREAAGAELRQAAQAADRARRILDQREAADRRAAREQDQRERDDPAPDRDRWPHKDPGYRSARREPRQPTAAELAAQNFPRTPRPPAARPPAPDPYERTRRPPEPPHRDGPSPSR